MEVSQLKSAIISQQESVDELFSRERIIEREASAYSRYLSHPNALFVTGIRRCGKSVLSIQLARGRKYLRVNFDDERLYGIRAKELDRVIESGYSILGPKIDLVILDEVQNVPGWELFVSRLREHTTVIVTGSNARLMSKEMATHLTGRHVDLLLYPFSFKEFLKYRGIQYDRFSTRSRGLVGAAFEEYLSLGGFPDVLKNGARMAEEIKRDIIIRDIVSRHRLRNERLFHEFARFLLNNFSREVSYNRLKNAFGLGSVHTSAEYLRYAEEAFLVFTVERYSRKTLSRYTMPKKVYTVDPSFQARKDEAGRVLENLVFLKIKQDISYKETSEEVHYWRDHEGEVDFVVHRPGRVSRLIQVTNASEEGEVDPRETKSLVRVGKRLRCRDLEVVTSGFEGERVIDGSRVSFVSIVEFLTR